MGNENMVHTQWGRGELETLRSVTQAQKGKHSLIGRFWPPTVRHRYPSKRKYGKKPGKQKGAHMNGKKKVLRERDRERRIDGRRKETGRGM